MALSMRQAINAKCKECLYDPLWAGGGTWRQQVEACSSPDCPLYELRPRSSNKNTERKPMTPSQALGLQKAREARNKAQMVVD